jgi:serine/threonine protein kinase
MQPSGPASVIPRSLANESSMRSRLSLLATRPSTIRWLIPLLVGFAGLLVAFVGHRTVVNTTDDLTRARFSEETQRMARDVGAALTDADQLLAGMHAAVAVYGPGFDLRNDARKDAAIGAVAHQLAGAVRAHEGVVYASASFPNGSFIGAYLEDDDKLHVQLSRTADSGPARGPTDMPAGARRRYNLRGFHDLDLIDDTPTPYDPRVRPFYLLAQRSTGPVWSDPYLFYEDAGTGITRTEAVYAGTQLIAVLTVDFNIHGLSQVIRHGAADSEVVALLHSDDGKLLALPDALRPKLSKPLDHPLTFHDIDAPMVRAFFENPARGRDSELHLHARGQNALALSAPLRNLGTLKWSVTALVPASVQAKVVAGHRTRSLLALALALAVSVALGAVFANWLERAQRAAQAAQQAATRAQAAADAAEQRALEAEGIAQKLGSYELVQCLGKGGMGEVWRASHRLLPRDAAVKLIRPEALQASNRDEVQMRFRREARSMAQLRSRNTVTILDYGVASNGSLFLVMELLDGFDVDKMVKTYGAMPASRVVYLMIQVCRSLAEAHGLRLVHRDVKPANIFLARIGDEFDIVKMLDFGLVHDAHKSDASEGDAPVDSSVEALSQREVIAVDVPSLPHAIASASSLPPSKQSSAPPESLRMGSGTRSTRTVRVSPPESLRSQLAAELTIAGTSMGTPSYMAPEQVLGEVVTAAADVYALGCVMIFMLTRRKLYRKPDSTSTMMAHVVEPIPDFETWADIPASLAAVIRACLQKSASDRPRDAAQLLEQLELVSTQLTSVWTARDARECWLNIEVPAAAVTATPEQAPQRLVIEAAAS